MPGTLAVEGLTELYRAFSLLGRDVKAGLVTELRMAAEPARSAAEQLAGSKIRNLHEGDRWASIKLGVNSKEVYLAPGAHRLSATATLRGGFRRGTPRPNLAVLLITRAMWPAAEQTRPLIVQRLEGWIGRVADQAGF